MVEDYVYVGRRRHWARTLIYGVLSVGIYGRVLLYKQVKEIDGHRALFIDLRVIAFLLFLPFLGPLAVKLKLRRLLVETLAQDITQPPVRRGLMLALAFVPIIPAFHMQVQHRLNRYWRRQRKVEDLKHMRADLEKLQAQRKTQDVKSRIAELEDRIERHQEALQDEEEAARAIREAEAERRAAEREFKDARRGPVRRMMASVKAAAARTGSSDDEDDDEDDEPSAEKERPKKAKAAKKAEPETDGDDDRPGLVARAKGAVARWRQTRADRKADKKEAKEKAKAAKAKEKSAKKAAKAKKKQEKKDAGSDDGGT